MNLIDAINPLFKFRVAERVWLRQTILNDRSWHKKNDQPTPHIHLIDCMLVIERIIIQVTTDSAYKRYTVRPLRFLAGDANSFVQYLEHELCDEAEAVAILKLRDSV
jgi:hypothetical protein